MCSSDLITKDRISQIGRIDGVKGVRNVTSAEVVIPYQEEVYGDYFKELYQSRYSPGNYDEDMELYRTDPKNDFFTSRFISVDEKGFELLNKNLEHKLDQKAFEDGKIAVALKFLNFAEGDFGMAGKTVHFFLPDGKHPAQEYSIQIAAVGDGWCNPAIFAGGMTPELIVSEKYAKRLMGELFTELIEVEYEDAFSADIEKKVKEVFEDEKQVSFESKLERYSEMKHSENQVKVLGNSIGFIIAALAVLNYLNMIAASIQNRAIELAILESVGMTAKQIKQMLQMEGLLYAAITITFSFVVGIPASYAVFDAMNIYRISFSVPWVSNLVLFGTILVLCMLAPVWMYQRTQNASVIERLRND